MKQLDEIKKRLAASTPKMCRETNKMPHFKDYIIGFDCCEEEPFVMAEMNRYMDNWKNDLSFLVNAKTDMELLIRVIEIQQEVLESIALDLPGLSDSSLTWQYRYKSKSVLAEAEKILGEE